ncbi:DUF86 domain-containing protein [Oxalobacteraceae bacterium A2-2]
MTDQRLSDYLAHIRGAIADAYSFVDGMSHEDFLDDKRTQQAVIMSILIVGEAATKLMSVYPGFIEQHPEIPWRSMRSTRNRIAHGYFDVDLDVLWETVQNSLPELLQNLDAVTDDDDE